MKYEITSDQIDAAVEVAGAWSSPFNKAVWAVLNKINIFRCEGCGGSGRFEAAGLYEDCEDCAKWGSHGWVRHG